MKNKIKKVYNMLCSEGLCKSFLKNKKVILGIVGIFLLGILLGYKINDNNHMRHIKNGVYQLNHMQYNKNSNPEVNIDFE